MQCNIDARGKAVRLLMGGLMVVAALVGAGLILMDVLPGSWGWPVVLALAVMGGFGMFEGAAGWCVVRAMGFRTRV